MAWIKIIYCNTYYKCFNWNVSIIDKKEPNAPTISLSGTAGANGAYFEGLVKFIELLFKAYSLPVVLGFILLEIIILTLMVKRFI